MALYVYGIMRSGDAARAVEAGAGRDRVDLETVEHDRISALVSATPGTELRLRRDNIMAHADVLQAAFEHGPVLPLRFGTAVADADTVRAELLAASADPLAARLDALENKVEMQLKAVYVEAQLLHSILAADRGLARTVERTQALPAAATHFERIRIGEAIAAAVQSRGEQDGTALLSALVPLTVGHIVSPPHHERAVMNVAFLVERPELSRFDQAVTELGEERGAEIEFKLIGPLPPYSFTGNDWNPRSATKTSAAWA